MLGPTEAALQHRRRTRGNIDSAGKGRVKKYKDDSCVRPLQGPACQNEELVGAESMLHSAHLCNNLQLFWVVVVFWLLWWQTHLPDEVFKVDVKVAQSHIWLMTSLLTPHSYRVWWMLIQSLMEWRANVQGGGKADWLPISHLALRALPSPRCSAACTEHFQGLTDSER